MSLGKLVLLLTKLSQNYQVRIEVGKKERTLVGARKMSKLKSKKSVYNQKESDQDKHIQSRLKAQQMVSIKKKTELLILQ